VLSGLGPLTVGLRLRLSWGVRKIRTKIGHNN
jgi:hypothetical protein